MKKILLFLPALLLLPMLAIDNTGADKAPEKNKLRLCCQPPFVTNLSKFNQDDLKAHNARQEAAKNADLKPEQNSTSK